MYHLQPPTLHLRGVVLSGVTSIAFYSFYTLTGGLDYVWHYLVIPI